MIRPKVLVAAREAGGAAGLAPVARTLVHDHDCGIVAIAADTASGPFERLGLPLNAFPEWPTADQVAALLERERPTAVLTGTSIYPDADAILWDGAAKRGIPTVAFVDHWCNYVERFSHRRPFDSLPDRIAVLDATAAKALTDAGCPRPIDVTGHPYFDHLRTVLAGVDRGMARRELGVDGERDVIVFASQPEESDYGTALNHEPHGLYSETEVAGIVRKACAEVVAGALLVIKLHPLQDLHAHDELAFATDRPQTRVLRSYPSPQLIMAADVVLGMTSMFLAEAALMGVPTISVRPGGGVSPT